MQGGFFLKKKPLEIHGLPLQQLENCSKFNCVSLAGDCKRKHDKGHSS
jgi:hypothetical protein